MLNRIFLFFMLLGSAGLYAAEVDHLYQVEVTVNDQGQAERNRAIQAGFRQMLVKVTGNRNVDQKSALQTVLKTASRYVQQYRYRVGDSAASSQRRYLQIFFDKLAVDRMLREQGMPVWGKSRPQVLAWVGFENNGKRKLLIPEFNPKVVSMLKRLSRQRGIPFMFPLMDLEDQAAVSTSDLWGAFEKPLADASRRYAADAIMLVTVNSVSANSWVARWSLLDGLNSRSWESRGNKLYTALQQGMHEMADMLAQAYAPAGGNQTQVLNMQVSAVDSFADQLKVQSFLDRQETVQGYQVRAVQADRLILSLNLRGGIQAFTQAANLSGFLVQEQGVVEIPPEQNTAAAQTGATDVRSPITPLVADIQLFYQMR